MNVLLFFHIKNLSLISDDDDSIESESSLDEVSSMQSNNLF